MMFLPCSSGSALARNHVRIVSSIRFEKPTPLSYQAETCTNVPRSPV